MRNTLKDILINIVYYLVLLLGAFLIRDKPDNDFIDLVFVVIGLFCIIIGSIKYNNYLKKGE